MKRVLAILLAAMLMIAVIPASALAAKNLTYGEVVRCSTSRDHRNVAMRKGPASDAAKNHVIKHGDKAVVVGLKGEYVQLKLFRNGNVGWLHRRYVDGTYNELIHNVHMIMKPSVVYRHAKSSSKTLGWLATGATVRVYKFSNNYAYVKGVNNGLEGGWVRVENINTHRVR